MNTLFYDKKILNKKAIGFVIILICILIVFILGSVIVKAGGDSSHNKDKKYFTNVTVESGDTLWKIAENNMDYNHYNSISDYVNELMKMNNLGSDEIYSGQNLIVTYYSDNN